MLATELRLPPPPKHAIASLFSMRAIALFFVPTVLAMIFGAICAMMASVVLPDTSYIAATFALFFLFAFGRTLLKLRSKKGFFPYSDLFMSVSLLRLRKPFVSSCACVAVSVAGTTSL